MAAAGKDPSTLSTRGAKFEELHRGGWDPKARAADQDCDGVVAEIIYPSVGMVLCNHEDLVKRACFDAYNRWLKDFCEGLPNRLFGMPQLVMETPEKGIEEVRKAKEMGFKGVMLPGEPGHEDYHHTDYDSFYEAVVEMEMPLSLFNVEEGQPAETIAGKDQFVPNDHSRQPGYHGYVRIWRCFRAASEFEARLRRSRRGLGTSLHVSYGPFLQAASLLA